MLLLVDIGNTRVKWATCVDGRVGPQHAAEHAGWTADDWRRTLFASPQIERVVAASVAGEQARGAMAAAAERNGVREVRFIASTAAAAGVRNAYPEPRLLGVDRWVAVIGAYHLKRRACCVVDVGTAATIDAVDDHGLHLGGFIVPGPHLMVHSLHAGTSDLAAHTAASPAGTDSLFADNTRDAIARGCRVALAALIDRSHAELARATGTDPALLCTGGAVGDVLSYVVSEAEVVPDLVLHGLATLAQSGA